MLRRRVLSALGAGAVAAAAYPLLRERSARAATPGRPRFFLQIVPLGGMDAIYTTDAKRAREVEAGVDVPYHDDKIVEASGLRLGPSFKALARWAPRLAVVNAFRQNSANHQSGTANVLRCKSHAAPSTPSLLELLGSRRSHGEATAAIHIGSSVMTAFSPAFLGQPSPFPSGPRPGLFDHLDGADPEDLIALGKALRDHARPLLGARATAAEKTTAEHLLASAELCSRVASLPKFTSVEWAHEKEGWFSNGRDLQRALWMFEHNLTRCATVCIGWLDFDTHMRNADQGALCDYVAMLVDHVLGELDKRTVDGRTMAEQTVVILGSEIGRFPRLNAAAGKDHFPQAPFVLFGPGLATGAFGATGRDMASLPISLATGKPEPGGHLLRVDDLGTTLLALDGANPEVYGYSGERLKFLVNA